MELELKIADFEPRTVWEFFKHFSERYGKVNSISNSGLTFLYLFHRPN